MILEGFAEARAFAIPSIDAASSVAARCCCAPFKRVLRVAHGVIANSRETGE
jgi:hypothetical protein